MRNSFLIVLISFFFLGCTAQQVQSVLDGYLGSEGGEAPLSTNEVVAGLKEALVKGVGTGTASASKTDGFFKNPKIRIPFPPEVKKVENKLRDIGLNKLVDDFVLSLNRGAEEAAKEAKPVFVNAVTSMTIEDAWNILKGDDKEAATNYLRKTTSNQLYQKFNPIIKRSLDKTNATKYYSDIITTYNKIPFVDKVESDLDDYATNKAMDGLFLLIAEEEQKIRKDPLQRTTDLLKKVFKAQD